MDERLEKKLVIRYPEIFRDFGGDMRWTCMAWGIDCGDGWFSLLDKMCKDVTELSNGKDIQVIATQVKEKFGGLRFYYIIESGYNILDRLNSKIRHLMFTRKLGIPYWKIVNFKRKLWKSTEEKISDRIEQAEEESYKICETCGQPGKISGGGWVYTACESCDEKYKLGNRRWKNPEEFPTIYEMMFGNE